MAIYYYYFDYKEIRSAMGDARQIDALHVGTLPLQRGEQYPPYRGVPTSTREIAGT
jgi:hypothetical protein